jgi:hypothetical protein
VLGAVTREQFLDALTIVGGISVLGAIAGWTAAVVWTLISGGRVALERWVVNGGGYGGLLGLALAGLDLLL